MPLTTTAGYTFPVQTPTTKTPDEGVAKTPEMDKSSYSSWNGDWLGYLNFMASKGDEAALDKLMNYFITESSNQTARDWTAQREDSQIQRFVEDAKKAGFNPMALLNTGASPISSSSSGSSYGGTSFSNQALKEETNRANWAKVITSFIAAIGMAVIALV